MHAFHGRGLLLDIEGTTSSVRFVHDVMFPFARERLRSHLANHWGDAATDEALNQLAKDANAASFAQWRARGGAANSSLSPAEFVAGEVLKLMAEDSKSTGLKLLQGQIWRDGFQGGKLVAHVYPDATERLREWREQGWDLRIYSSGSVATQHLFFRHTVSGNLLPLFSGHYDTTIGGKMQPGSYERIARQFPCATGQILFVSDLLAELDAAAKAGLATALSVRPENEAVGEHAHPVIHDFHELNLSLAAA